MLFCLYAGPAAVSPRRSLPLHSLTLVSHVWKRASVDAHWGPCWAAASPLPWRKQSRAARTMAAFCGMLRKVVPAFRAPMAVTRNYLHVAQSLAMFRKRCILAPDMGIAA